MNHNKTISYNSFLSAFNGPYLFAFITFIICCSCTANAYGQIDELPILEGYKGEIFDPPIKVNWGITDMVVDDKGLAWIGAGMGLLRFDSYDYKLLIPGLYEKTNNISNQIQAIHVDSAGTFWLALLWRGFYKFHPDDPKQSVTEINFNKQGLFNPSLYDITSDNKGNIWACGKGPNLYKYDTNTNESTYITIPHNGSIEGVYSILHDNVGIIWLGTSNGLYAYFPEKNAFKHFAIKPGNKTQGNRVYSVFKDKSNQLWAAAGSGLYQFDPSEGKFKKVFVPNPNLPDKNNVNAVFAIAEDSEENIWFRVKKGLIKYNPHQKTFGLWKSVVSDNISFTGYKLLYIDGQDNIWVNNMQSTILKLTKTKNKFKWYLNNSKSNFDIHRNGIILSAEATKPKKIQDIVRFRPVPVSGICEDKDKNLWISIQEGSSGSELKVGLNHLNIKNNQLIHYPFDPEEPTNRVDKSVEMMVKDKYGDIWFRADWVLYKIVQKENGEVNFKKYQHDPGQTGSLAPPGPIFIYHDENDSLCIATEYLNIYDRKKDAFIHFDNNLYEADSTYTDTCWQKDIPGEKWVPCADGIVRLIPPFTEISEYKMRASKIIKYKYRASDDKSLGRGPLWGGIYFSKHYQPGTLWVATRYGGLNKLEWEKIDNTHKYRPVFKKYTTKDGLIVNSVYNIVEDKNGNLWLGTGLGISKFDPRKETFINYDRYDGLPATAIFHSSIPSITKNGKIYFGTMEGGMSFYPDSLGFDSVPLPVIFTDFRIYNKSIAEIKESTFDMAISYTQKVELTHKQNYITIEFAALEYQSVKRNNYKYKLEGLDDGWIDANDNRIASYQNLKPGEYTFMVNATNSNGKWNPEPTSLEITIYPPWWETWWFKSILIFLFLTSGPTIYFLRVKKLKKEKQVLEDRVNSRTKTIEEQKNILTEQKEELLQQKEELQITLENLKETQNQLVESEKMAAIGGLVAGVAHEINTPVGIGVTGITNLLDETNKMAELYKQNSINRQQFKSFLQSTYDTASLIQKNLERTADLIQSFKQVSIDQTSEQKRSFNLKYYMYDIIRSLHPKFKHKAIQFEVLCNDKLVLESYPGAYAQVFTNLILNSVIHGFNNRSEGKISIQIHQHKNDLEIIYKDNGNGIKEQHLGNIFKPFYTIDSERGSGLGLNIVYNIVKQKFNGTIECSSKEGAGVTFRMTLQINEFISMNI